MIAVKSKQILSGKPNITDRMHFPLIKPPPIHLALKCWIVKTDKNPDSYLVRVGMWIVGGRWDTQNIFKNFLCRVATGPYTSDREERIWLPNYTLLHPIVFSSEGAWVSQMSLRLSVCLSVRHEPLAFDYLY